MRFASLTHTPDGVTIVGNDPKGGYAYLLVMTWDELWELAAKRGQKMTPRDLERRSRESYRDLFDDAGPPGGSGD